MPQTAIVTATTLNLRPVPSTDRAPLARLPRATRLEVVDTAGAWYRVRTPEGQGFVHGDFIVLLDEDPAAGFLAEREELEKLPLPAPADARLEAPPSASPGERAVASTWNGQGGLLGALAERIELDPGLSLAVLLVESGGRNFDRTGRLVIRFENHVFWQRWGKRQPETYRAHFAFDEARRWQGHRFRKDPEGSWEEVHGAGQDGEWRVFELARRLDEGAALESISMGGPQIMGFNHHLIGYESPAEMLDRFAADGRFHLLGLFDFIKGPGTTSRMLQALQRGQLEEFASHYNGPGQAARYAGRIARYHDAWNGLTG